MQSRQQIVDGFTPDLDTIEVIRDVEVQQRQMMDAITKWDLVCFNQTDVEYLVKICCLGI